MAERTTMYERFFGLDEPPFRLTPDPRYFFLSQKHRDALGHLVYGIREGAGFVAITGEIGAGKTTLLRKLLREEDDATRYAYVLNPVLTGMELLQEINHELGLPIGENRREMLGHLNQFLLERKREGRNVVLVIDEAQALDGTILEQLRMLSNFETETAKLLQIVLVGQPELRDLLLRPDLQQLNQRITVRWHLGPLDREETAQYIEHRLAVASGGAPRHICTRRALRRVHAAARGIPRLINLLCHRALLRAYASDRSTVTAAVVGNAIRELEDPLLGSAPRWGRAPVFAGGAAVAAAVAVGAFLLWPGRLPAPATTSPAPLAERVSASEGGGAPGTVPIADAALMAAEPLAPQVDAHVARVANASPAATPGLDLVPPGAIAAPGPVRVSAVELGEAALDPAGLAAVEGGADSVEVERLAFLEAVQQSSPGQSAYEATEALLRSWGAEQLTPAEAAGSSLDLPEIARQRGLRYLALQGNLNTLRVLDLPVILEVAPDDGSPARFVALEQLAESSARVAVGRETLEMTPVVLAESWFGKAHLFWQDIDRMGAFLALGQSSDAVYRLHERLRAADVYVGGDSPVFAPETEAAVLRFQQRERLVADGKVGPMTMIALYRRTSPERLPRLAGTPAPARVAGGEDRGFDEDRWVGTLEGGVP
jgi:general secretion pathway protein A